MIDPNGGSIKSDKEKTLHSEFENSEISDTRWFFYVVIEASDDIFERFHNCYIYIIEIQKFLAFLAIFIM